MKYYENSFTGVNLLIFSNSKGIYLAKTGEDDFADFYLKIYLDLKIIYQI